MGLLTIGSGRAAHTQPGQVGATSGTSSSKFCWILSDRVFKESMMIFELPARLAQRQLVQRERGAPRLLVILSI